MSFTYVQSTSNAAVGSLAYGSANTAGNLLVVYLGSNSADGATVTDSNSNTYAKLMSFTGNYGMTLWACFSCNAGSNTVTAASLTTNPNCSMAILEYSTPPSYNWDAQGGSPALFSQLLLGQTLLVVGVYDFHSSHSWTPTGLVVRETTSAPDSETLGVADAVVSSVGLSDAFVMSGGAASTNGMVLVLTSGGGGGLLLAPGMEGA